LQTEFHSTLIRGQLRVEKKKLECTGETSFTFAVMQRVLLTPCAARIASYCHFPESSPHPVGITRTS
jgi:hypothetical protein